MSKNQRTIINNVKLEGIGLHTGKKVQMEFMPAPINTGVIFERTDIEGKPQIKACLENVVSTNRGTVLSKNGIKVNTVEHVLSAMRAMGIDNVRVCLTDEEPPVMDGSAIEYVKAIKKAGIQEQDAQRKEFFIKDKFYMEDKDKKMLYIPSDKFEVTFTLAYTDNIIKPQVIHVEINEEEYINHIGIARTFGFEHEFEMLKANNLARGGSLENAVVINNDGTIRNEGGLREPNELILHKILDLIGDFSLLGCPIKGHIIAEKTGHSFNTKFASKIKEKFEQAANMSNSGTMYIEEIKKYLPHRYPFLLVDRIVAVVPGEMVQGYKNFTANEELFNGHFPQKPVVPGVILIEAMAQVAGLLFLPQEQYAGKIPLLCGIDRVRFRRPVVPGDRIDYTIKVLKIRGNTGKVSGEGRVDGELAMSGELMFQLI